jgi:hypothetical protein
MRKRLFDKLAVVSLVFLIVFSCFSMLVPHVKADTYNQIPLGLILWKAQRLPVSK